MALPLMPKATAVWLVDNTSLSFSQIAAFCGMHELEIQAVADGEVAGGIVGSDPIATGQLTRAEIDRCEKDEGGLAFISFGYPAPKSAFKGARYTPVSKRQDRPDAIAWLLKQHPELSDAQICKLVGTTKTTIEAIRSRSHWNIAAIKPRNPIILGICSEADLEKALALAAPRRATIPSPDPPMPDPSMSESTGTLEEGLDTQAPLPNDENIPTFLRTKAKEVPDSDNDDTYYTVEGS